MSDKSGEVVNEKDASRHMQGSSVGKRREEGRECGEGGGGGTAKVWATKKIYQKRKHDRNLTTYSEYLMPTGVSSIIVRTNTVFR